jgi:hypothetical protein
VDAKHKTEEWSKLAKEQAEDLLHKGEKAVVEGREKLVETIKPKDKPAEV